MFAVRVVPKFRIEMSEPSAAEGSAPAEGLPPVAPLSPLAPAVPLTPASPPAAPVVAQEDADPTVGMAFVAPVIQDNPTGWGPCEVLARFRDMPYQPFSKGDRLGKISDWTCMQDKRYASQSLSLLYNPKMSSHMLSIRIFTRTIQIVSFEIRISIVKRIRII